VNLVTVGAGTTASGIGASFEQANRIKKTSMVSLRIINNSLLRYMKTKINLHKTTIL